MSYIIFTTLLLAAASGILSLQRQLQILQQGSYSLSEYFKWLKDSYTTELAVSAIFYCAITIGIIKDKAIISLILATMLMILRIVLGINAHKKQTTKLAFTARVKGLYITAILMLGAFVFVSMILSGTATGEVFRMMCLVLSTITPVLTLIVLGVTYPLQKLLAFKKKKGADD